MCRGVVLLLLLLLPQSVLDTDFDTATRGIMAAWSSLGSLVQGVQDIWSDMRDRMAGKFTVMRDPSAFELVSSTQQLADADYSSQVQYISSISFLYPPVTVAN